jgi:glycosyltransferase involved in cell wall biosynthesis
MPALVSIALCTYNGGKFLSRQLDTLLAQSYENIEIIAVDDRSADNTWDILKEYAGKDKRLKIYCNDKNLGHTCNFEKAIKLCTGDYVALCDQDDVWETDKIKALMEGIGDGVMIYHNSDFIDEEDKRIGNNTMATKNRMYDGECCLPVILANPIHGHAILFDSKLKDHLFPFNEKFSHDWALAFASFNIGRVKYLDRVLVHYRQHQYSITDFLEQRQGASATPKLKSLGRLPVNANWLNYCLDFQPKREPELVNTACQLFLNLTNGKNKFKCFVFMMKHFDMLFYTIGYKQRGFISKLNFVRKLCFA